MPKAISKERLLTYNHEVVRAAGSISGKRTEYRVEGVPGLVLRVMPSGVATWWFYYRHKLGLKWKSGSRAWRAWPRDAGGR